MGRRKLSEETGRIQINMLLDDPAQRYAFEQIEAMMGQGIMQDYMRKLLVAHFPMKPTETDTQKVLAEFKNPVVKPSPYERPAFNPVPKPK